MTENHVTPAARPFRFPTSDFRQRRVSEWPPRHFDFVGAAGALLEVAGVLTGGATGVLDGGVTGGRSKLFVGMAAGEFAGETGGGTPMGVCDCFCCTAFSNSDPLFRLYRRSST